MHRKPHIIYIEQIFRDCVSKRHLLAVSWAVMCPIQHRECSAVRYGPGVKSMGSWMSEAGLSQENTKMGGHTLMKLLLCLSTWETNTGHTDMGPQLQLVCVRVTLGRVTNIPQFRCLKLPLFCSQFGGSGVWEGLSLWFFTWMLSEGGWVALIQKPPRT